jgi:hypothetical protein
VLLDYLDDAWLAVHRVCPGFLWQASEDDMCLDLTATTLDAYLAALPAEARGGLRRIRRQAERAGFCVERLDPAACPASDLYRLMQNVHARYGEAGSPYRPSVFADLALLPSTVLGVVRAKDRIVACGALLVDREDATLKLLGLDYSVSLRTLEMVLGLALIEAAGAAGVRRLWLGTTQQETKTKRFGARRVPRHTGVAGRGAYGALLRAAGLSAA